MSTVGERRVARRWLAGAVGACLGFGSLVATTSTARAEDGDLLARLPRVRIEPYLVAATGDGLVNLFDENDTQAVSVSADRGATWTDASTSLRRANYAADGKVRYIVDRDNGATDLYTYDVASASTSDPVSFPGPVVAVGRQEVVYGTNATEDEEATELAAAPLEDPASGVDLTLPNRGADRRRILVGAGDLGVAVSTSRDAQGRVQTGYLDVVALHGGATEYQALSVAGLVAAEIRNDEVSYLTAGSTGVKACQRSLSSAAAWQVERCLAVTSGDDRAVSEGVFLGGPDWAAFSLVRGDSYVGAYLADWSTSTPKSVKLKASGSVKMILLQDPANDLDRPLAIAYTAYSSSSVTGYVAKVGPTGSLSRFADWPTGQTQPNQLSLTTARMAGTDYRNSGTAWSRTLTDPDTEHVLATNARQVLVSGGWTAINGIGGLALYDHDKQVAKTGSAWARVWQLSGPYLLGLAKAKDKVPTVLASGKTVTFKKWIYPCDVFGSWVAAVDTDNWTADVYNVASGKPVAETSISLNDDYDSADVYLWGDTMVVNGWFHDGSTEVVVKDWRDDTTLATLPFTDSGQVFSLSDGAALIWHDDGSVQVLSLATMATDLSLAEGSAYPVMDDGGRVLYATDSHLVVHQVPRAGQTAPRALWSSAQKSFNSFAGRTSPFLVSVDATKSMASGFLVVQKEGQGDTPKVSIPVEASADGSLRIGWNGRMDDGTPASPGDWDWHLEGFDELRAIDGMAYVNGTVRITNTRVTYPQSAPKLDDTKPAMGDVLTADPGTVPDGVVPTFQWYRGSKAVKGATGASYTVAAGDVGQTLKVKVTIPASTHYLASSKYSASTAKVARGSLVKGTAALAADAPQVDVPFVVAPAGWGPDPVALSYQWYQVDSKGKAKSISKATKATYTPSAAVVGYRLKVVVTGSKAGYSTAAVTSVLTEKVLAGAYSEVPTPKVTGSPQVGKALVADPGNYLAADGHAVTPALAYQWYRVADGGDIAIKGATKAAYKPVATDVGHALKVKVTAKRSGYPNRTTWSDPTDPVALPD